MEEKLNDYQKSVLSNGETLRAKLLIYLQKPEAVEYYAKTAEKCFLQGNKDSFAKVGDWSWWGFFYSWTFLLYRKSENAALWAIICICLGLFTIFLSQNESPENASPVIGIIFIIAIWISCHLGKYSKFYILKTFVNTLKESNEDDALLASKGGINKIGLVLGILATPLVIIQAIFLISIIPGIIYGVLAPRIG